MAKRTNIAEIARAAGVGTATVERVMNARGNVRPETAERVILAARALGYDRQMPELYRGIIRIEVVMIRPDSTFFTRLNVAFSRIAASLSRSINIHRTFVDDLDINQLAEHILNPKTRRSGLIIVAPDDPRIGQSIQALRMQGVPVVSVVSRVGRDSKHFVGIDNYVAGRTAAFYMTQFQRHRSGTILTLTHGTTYSNHRDRLQGFYDYLAERGEENHSFPRIAFGRDDADETRKVLHEAFQAHPDCIGLYNAGGANRAVAEVLTHRPPGASTIMWIGHELTDKSRRWLKSGLMQLVLDQAPETQARRSIDRILQLVGFLDLAVDPSPVPFHTYTSENC